MKIVVDTNVVISGVFFGGMPRKLLSFLGFLRLIVFDSPIIPHIIFIIALKNIYFIR